MTRATYQFVIRWPYGPIGNSGLFDPPSAAVPVAGAYDDISADVISCTIRRGRNDPASTIGAGTCTLQVRDPNGDYVAGYASSVLVGGASDGMGDLQAYRTLRVRGIHGAAGTQDRFYGYITSVIANPDGKTATIQASDALEALNQQVAYAYVQPSATSVSNALLFLITTQFNGQYIYSPLAPGLTLPAAIGVPEEQTPLSVIGNILAADRGLFFIDRSGVFTYYDRAWHDRPPNNTAQFTLANTEVRLLDTGFDVNTIRNSATVTGLGDLLAAPSGAPTLTTPVPTPPATSNLGAANYTVGYSYATASGETALSPTTTVAAAAGDVVRVAAIAPPAGVTAVNFYLSVAPGSTYLRRVRSNATGATEDFEALPSPDAPLPLTTGTARVATAQAASDATSQAKYFRRPAGSLTSPYLATDADALTLANWIVARGKDLAPAGYAADLDGDAGDNAMTAILRCELQARVSIDAIRVGQGEYFILGIEETIAENRHHTCRWLLQRRRAQDVSFVWGYSGWGNAAWG